MVSGGEGIMRRGESMGQRRNGWRERSGLASGLGGSGGDEEKAVARTFREGGSDAITKGSSPGVLARQ